MSGMMARSDRPGLSTEDFSKVPESEMVSMAEGFIGYSGRYEIVGDKVVHQVEMSFIPNWVGVSLERFCDLKGF
jgi:hypothetical protein